VSCGRGATAGSGAPCPAGRPLLSVQRLDRRCARKQGDSILGCLGTASAEP
jgi:hypothetical protein